MGHDQLGFTSSMGSSAPLPSHEGSPVRVQQDLNRSDKELFTIMSQELQVQDVRLDHTSKPMNMSLNTLRTDPRVTMHLLPLMHRGRGSADDSKGSNSKAASQQDPKGRKHGANKINKASFKPSKRVKDLCSVELKQYIADSDNFFARRPIGSCNLVLFIHR